MKMRSVQICIAIRTGRNATSFDAPGWRSRPGQLLLPRGSRLRPPSLAP